MRRLIGLIALAALVFGGWWLTQNNGDLSGILGGTTVSEDAAPALAAAFWVPEQAWVQEPERAQAPAQLRRRARQAQEPVQLRRPAAQELRQEPRRRAPLRQGLQHSGRYRRERPARSSCSW